MSLILLFLAIFASEVLTSEDLLDQDHYDLNNAKEIFAQFVRKYGKNYEESEHRFKVFKDNLEKINKWNKEGGETRYGINEFTDMSFEEFSKNYLGFNGNVSLGDAVEYQPSGLRTPASLDYRQHGYVTEVKQQGRCQSCFIFSAIGNIEGQHAKNHQTRAISLSEQQGLDCGGNCQGGFPHQVFQNLASQGGCMREEEYPYEAHQNQCRTRKDRIAVRVTGGRQLGVNEATLKDAVANIGPLSIGLCTDAYFSAYSGGVFVPQVPCTQANHAVTLIGYGNEGGTDYWLIKNSWGDSWGEQGYMKLVRGRGASAIGSYAASSDVA